MGPVERRLLGNNLQWVDRGDELLVRDSLRFAPKMLELVQRLSPTVLRYPGGCQAESYHWKDGIGPYRERKLGDRFFDRRKEKVVFGTDEFLELCRDVGAEPLITVNVASGSPEEAAEWVAYVNKPTAAGRPKGLPKVNLWEIGNEPYLQHDKRPELNMAPEEYVRRARRVIKAMKKVDPGIQVGVPLRSDKLGGVPATPYPGYADKVLEGLAGDLDFVAVHNAYYPSSFGRRFSDRDLYLAAMAGPRVVADDMQETKTMLARHRPGKHTPIAVTEYNALFSLGQPTDKYIDSQAGALYVADVLRVFATTPEVFCANYWSLTGNWYFGAISNRGEIRAGYLALEGMSHVLRGSLVDVEVDGPTFSTPAVGFTARQADVPAVTALATRERETLRLVVLNKDRLDPADARIEFGAGTTPRFVSARELTTDRPFDAPKGWRQRELSASKVPLDLQLPPHSITIFEFDLGGGGERKAR